MKEDFSKGREVQGTESVCEEERLNDCVPIEVTQAYRIKELEKENKNLNEEIETSEDYINKLLEKIKLFEEYEKLAPEYIYLKE